VGLLEEAVAYQTAPMPEQPQRRPIASPGLHEDLAKAKLAAGDRPGACRAYRDALAALKRGNHTSGKKALEASVKSVCGE
jgi:hypothetical protein